jgi:hypothetical protein
MDEHLPLEVRIAPTPTDAPGDFFEALADLLLDHARQVVKVRAAATSGEPPSPDDVDAGQVEPAVKKRKRK